MHAVELLPLVANDFAPWNQMRDRATGHRDKEMVEFPGLPFDVPSSK